MSEIFGSGIPIVSSLLVGLSVFLASQGIAGAWDAGMQVYLGDLAPMSKTLRFQQQRMQRYLRAWGIALFVIPAAIALVGKMIPIAFAAFVLLLLTPRWVLQTLIRKRKELLRDQMVGASVSLASACRAGLSLAAGLDSVRKDTADPLASELDVVLREYEHGRPLPAAIADTRDRLNLDSFTLFSSAILVSLERGGRITESLERISHSLQENQRIERRLESETASGRRVVWILAICPIVFLSGFYVLNPEGTTMVFQTLIGQFVMLCVIALVTVSILWSHRILALEV